VLNVKHLDPIVRKGPQPNSQQLPVLNKRDLLCYLQDLVRPGRIPLCLDGPQHVEDLVDDLSRDETAELQFHILDKGHAQQGDPRLDGCENVAVAGQGVV